MTYVLCNNAQQLIKNKPTHQIVVLLTRTEAKTLQHFRLDVNSIFQ